MNQNDIRLNHLFQHTECLTKEQLISYANDTLAGPELRKVEMHLIDCPLCSDAADALIQHGTAGFEASLDRMRPDFSAPAAKEDNAPQEPKVIEFPRTTNAPAGPNSPGKRRGLMTYLSIAAAVAMLVAFAYIFMSGPSTPGQIADKYYQFENPSMLRSHDHDDDSALISPKNLMADSHYADAAQVFAQIANDEAAFHAGQCYFQIGKIQEAKEQFKRSMDIGVTVFAQKSAFKLALLHLDLNEVSQARPILEKITADRQHTEFKAATEALRDLDRISPKP